MKSNSIEGEVRLEGSAAEQGFRMPAEWEEQTCVWLVHPHNHETWPVAWMKPSASGKLGARSCRKLLKFVKLVSVAFPRTTVGFETSDQSLFRTQRAVSLDIRFASMDGVTSTNHACSMMQFPARFLDGVICRCGIMILCSKVDRLMSMEPVRS